MICLGLFVTLILNYSQLRNPLKKMFLSEDVIFRGLRLSLGHFGQQAMSLSFKMVYPYLLHLLSLWTYWHLKITQGPTRFSMGILEGVKMLNGKPREQLVIQWADTAVFQ